MKNRPLKALALLCALILALPAFADTLPIGIPDDGTNLSRGIKLLESAGLISVDPAAGYTPEIADITGYLYNIEVMPVQANTLPATLQDFAASAINGTYASPIGLVPSRDGLIIEKQDENGENPYVNIIAARESDKDNPVFQTIVKAYQNDLVAQFLLVYYEETFFPAFPYDANLALTKEEAEELSRYTSDESGKQVVTVGVAGANNDQWKVVQKLLDDAGETIFIKLVEFDAYNLPNDALNAGDIDLNAFQHKAFLAKEVEQNGYQLVSIGDTLIAPLTLYSKQFDSLDALKEAAGKAE